MTTLVATLGLMPAALSHGIGSQTQKPLAIVVIGGSLILAILTRVGAATAARGCAPLAGSSSWRRWGPESGGLDG